MNKIKNVLICGLGAIGGYYASRILNSENYNLKILVDESRYLRYRTEPKIINGVDYKFDYILPEDNSFSADLIIIATKFSGLEFAINNIKNFVSDNTTILSFLNGISSEREIAEVYGKDKVLYSFLLGHTFFRHGNLIEHDGHATIYFGSPNKENIDRIESVKIFFKNINVLYNIPEDILNALWNKFCFNCCANQISALTKMTFGEMKSSKKCLKIMERICSEISDIAIQEGITNPNEFYTNTLKNLDLMIPNGKTSMLQDIEAGIKPEIEIFGKTVVKLGQKYGIKTPYNKVISDFIDLF